MALLEVTNICKRFGGISAVDQVDFAINDGEIVGLIGPNGSGKTTLFNLITGYHTPDRGKVVFRGENITGLPTYTVNRKGIARTFQITRLFLEMTVLENVMIGALARSSTVEEAREKALACLERVDLVSKKDALADTLSTGMRKRLEAARALATSPRLLLLDELTGGVDPLHVRELIDMVKHLREEGITLVIIEHNMRVIMSLSDRVVAMYLGKKLAEGTASEVTANPTLIEAYLGGSYA